MSIGAPFLLACLALAANPIPSGEEPVGVPVAPMHIKVSLHVVGAPRLGEPITLVYTATPDIDAPKMRLDFMCLNGSQLVSGNGVTYTSCKKGETRAYKVTVKFLSPVPRICIDAHICSKNEKGEEVCYPSGGTWRDWHLVDEETGLFGGLDEWLNHPSRRVLMLYNFYDGEWLSVPTEESMREFYRTNLKIVSEMRKYEPSITDSEALCLYADIANTESPYKYHGPVEWSLRNADPEKYLLDRGWLEKHRQGGHVKELWLKALSDSLSKEWEAIREEFENRDRLELERMQGADDTLRQGQEESELKGGCAQITVSSEPGAPADKPAETDEVPYWGAILPARTTLEVSQYSRIGDEVELICTVTPDVDVPKLRVSFTFQMGAEPVSEPTVFYVSAKKGEPKTCRVGAKLTSAPVKITANVASCFKDYRGDEVVRPSQSAILRLYLVDEETGRLATSPTGLKSGSITEDEATSQFQESLRPKLVWEKEFDRDIVSVGVDEERFNPKKQNITSCLKWIQFEGGEFYLFDTGRADLGTSLGIGSRASVSRNMRYFILSIPSREEGTGHRVYHHRALDWSGRVIWETDCPGLLSPRVSNNASAAFLELSMDDLWTWIHGVRFYSPKGHLLHEYTFDEGRLLFEDYSSSSNGAFSVLATRKGVFVFGRAGDAIWSRGRVEKYGMEYRRNTEHGNWFRRAAVTDSGEVLLVHRIDSSHFRLATYDAQGLFVDSKAFSVGVIFDLEAAGRKVFASMSHASGTGPNRIFLYDFSSREARTIVEEPLHYFMALDVDAGSNLAAVVATNEHAGDIRILVYGFSGESRGEIRLPEAEYSNPWFRLLGNALLVAEGKKLKLYALSDTDGEE